MIKRSTALLLSVLILFALVSCGTSSPAKPASTPAASSLIVPTSVPTPVPTPEPTPEPDPVKGIIDTLSDRELIGQLVMMGFDGTTKPPDSFVELMTDYKVGNVILFGWNIQTFDQTAKLCKNILACNPTPDIPMFISTDVEGGSVLRFKWSPHIKSAKTLGEKGDTDFAYEQFLRIGKALLGTGINVDLAPVLDIAKNPNSTFLGKRMYGSDPEKAAPIACAAIKGLQDAGCASVGKHYPGHGNTATDSHNSLPVLKTSLSSWNSYERLMFEAAIDNGIDGMLVGHMSYPEIDENNISSLSYTFITELLREEMGFDGFIMSDDMRMRAVTSQYEIGEASVRFLEAGGDLVLAGRYIEKQKSVLEAIYTALESGRLTRERLEQSAYRIISAKLKYKDAAANAEVTEKDGPGATASATPKVSATPDPSASATAKPSAKPSVKPTSKPTKSPQPTEEPPKPTKEPEPTDPPEPEGTDG